MLDPTKRQPLRAEDCRDRLRVKTEEHPMMLAEPTFNPREARERTLEVCRLLP